jgi:hypothetical protein
MYEEVAETVEGGQPSAPRRTKVVMVVKKVGAEEGHGAVNQE